MNCLEASAAVVDLNQKLTNQQKIRGKKILENVRIEIDWRKSERSRNTTSNDSYSKDRSPKSVGTSVTKLGDLLHFG